MLVYILFVIYVIVGILFCFVVVVVAVGVLLMNGLLKCR